MARDEERAQQLAAVTPDEILAFVVDMVADGRPGYRIVQVSYPTADARKLGLAKRALETYCAWKPDSKREEQLAPVIAGMARIMHAARIDKGADRVSFDFEPGDVALIKSAIPALDDFAMTKAMDARPGRKGGRR